MNLLSISTVARHYLRHKFMVTRMLVLLLIYTVALVGITLDRWRAYEHQNHLRVEHQEQDRESWESNPDKHPHRMAHFGAFAFRIQHPLSVFDAGLEQYLGNVVFLEAHKQNTANFSEASLSTDLIRFGDLHVAMILNLILPLFIFFIGYDAISREREQQTLRLIYVQGTGLRDLILGRTLGLFAGALLFFLPAIAALTYIAWLTCGVGMDGQVVLRIALLIGAYTAFFLILSLLTVIVSAWSKKNTQSLLTLLGLWLVLFVVTPKVGQALGVAYHPNPSKIAFKRAIEVDVTKIGDSHNPNDPYFKGIKDSILRAYGVDSVSQLPFNFGGYIMGVGEELTSTIHADHQKRLTDTYREQNKLVRYLSLISPHLAIKQISMGLSGTDFETYNDFLIQSEAYRYNMAMYMTELQKKFVDPKHLGSTEGKKNAVRSEEFKRFKPFEYSYLSVSQVLRANSMAIISLLTSRLVLTGIALSSSKLFRVH